MRAFISYSWDSEEHKEWVRQFADGLIANGVDVTLDQYDLVIGIDRFRFMEKAVSEADFVLVICTPEYVKRANERERGVGAETSLISSKFFDERPGKELIPIIRAKGPSAPHTPDYMAALYFADFRDDAKFDRKMEDLLRHVHRQPRHAKPPLGQIPRFNPGSGTRSVLGEYGTLPIDNAGRVFISQPFASRNRERIADATATIAGEMGLRLSFSHVPTQAPVSRSRLAEIIVQAHGFIAVWDDTRLAHALLRPWRTFEFEAAKLKGVPSMIFCHSRFIQLIKDAPCNVVVFAEEDLEEKLRKTFEALISLSECSDRSAI